LFQYNAEIVPVLIFATIEAIVLILWAAQTMMARLRLASEKGSAGEGANMRMPNWLSARLVYGGLLTVLSCFILFSALRMDYYFHGNLPYSQGYRWPTQTQ